MRKKRLLLVVAALALVAVPLLVNPFPRQLLFGQKLLGIPLCAWQESVRRQFDPGKEPRFLGSILAWLGHGNSDPDVETLTVGEKETLFLSLAADADLQVRKHVAEKLCGRESHEVLACLLVLLEDADETVRDAAFVAIRNSDSCVKAAWPRLKVLLEHPEHRIRVLVVRLMADGKVEREETLAFLVRMLDDPQAKVRAAAGNGLGQYPWRRKRMARVALAKLEERLADADALCRVNAAYAHWNIARDSERVVPVLRAASKNSEPKVRTAALECLGSMDIDTLLAAWDERCRAGERSGSARQHRSGSEKRGPGDAASFEREPLEAARYSSGGAGQNRP